MLRQMQIWGTGGFVAGLQMEMADWIFLGKKPKTDNLKQDAADAKKNHFMGAWKMHQKEADYRQGEEIVKLDPRNHTWMPRILEQLQRTGEVPQGQFSGGVDGQVPCFAVGSLHIGGLMELLEKDGQYVVRKRRDGNENKEETKKEGSSGEKENM